VAHGEGSGPLDGKGRSLAAPGRFASDDGSPDMPIREAIDSFSLTTALRAGRVIVAVVAMADETTEVDGVTVDKSSEMSLVSMIAKDGRRGLLAFTGIDALRAWDPSARPVPVSGVDAARAAIDDDCEALVLDVAGPRMQVVPEADLVVLAGLDRWEHARNVATRILTERFGEEKVCVIKVGERLQVTPSDASIVSEDLASSVTARILALVPEGVEVLDG